MDITAKITLLTGLGGVVLGALLSWAWFIFEKYLDRRSRHFNALVRIEYTMSENLDTSYSNISGLEQFKDMLEKKHLFYFSFKEFNSPQPAIYDLQNIRFINDIFEIHLDMERVNNSIAALAGRYAKIVDSFLVAGGHRNPEATNDYFENANIVIRDIDMILSFARKLDSRLVEITAKSKVLFNHRPRLIDQMVRWLGRVDTTPEKFDQEVATTSQVIQKDRERHTEEYGVSNDVN